MPLESLSQNQLLAIAQLLEKDPHAKGLTWKRIVEIAGDPSIASRAAEWLPEAFGFVLVGHLPGVQVELPQNFSAKSADGRWHEIAIKAEPIAIEAILLAMRTMHSGSRALFESLALRSSLFATVNEALNASADLDGVLVSGPAFASLPAEPYLA